MDNWKEIKPYNNDLMDHYYYLVAHKDFDTPIKAKYHDDQLPCFECICHLGVFYSYLIDKEITHYMELPPLPYDKEAHDD